MKSLSRLNINKHQNYISVYSIISTKALIRPGCIPGDGLGVEARVGEDRHCDACVRRQVRCWDMGFRLVWALVEGHEHLQAGYKVVVEDCLVNQDGMALQTVAGVAVVRQEEQMIRKVMER